MAECPLCKEKVGANDFRPSAEAACSVCGQRPASPPPADPWWVSAAPSQPSETEPAPAHAPPEPWWMSAAEPEHKTPVVTQLAPPEPNELKPAPRVEAPSPSPPPRVAPKQSMVPPRNKSTKNEKPRSWLGSLGTLDYGSALAFLCFSVALVFNSFYTLEPFIKPLAALGLLAGLLGGALPALWRRRNPFFPLLLSSLCLVVLLFVGSWPRFSTEPPALFLVPMGKKGMTANQLGSADEWVDASTNAVKLGDVQVQILSVRIGAVPLNPPSAATASADRCLMIHLRASYEGILFQPTPYQPWADLVDSPSKNPPTLTDDHGRAYDQKTFAAGSKVVGRADGDGLTPGHQVKEVLVYPVPTRDVEYLRLTLPASAFGVAGAFRFQIPRGMIRGL